MNKPTYDFAQGSVFYEVELLLSSDSGRSKHTDIVDQGAWLVLPFKDALTSVPLEGAAFGKIRYWGASLSPTGEPISETDVGPFQTPYSQEVIAQLRGIVSGLALLLGELEREGASLPPDVHELVEWAEGTRDLGDVSNDDLRHPLWPTGGDAE